MKSLPIYYITRETYEEQVREPNDDGWDQADYEKNVSIVACSFVKPSREQCGKYGASYSEETAYYYSEKLVEKAYAVSVIYYDGSTFGSTSGYRSVCGFYETREMAEEVEQQIKTGKYNTSGYNRWEGYFAGIECIKIEKYKILRTI